MCTRGTSGVPRVSIAQQLYFTNTHCRAKVSTPSKAETPFLTFFPARRGMIRVTLHEISLQTHQYEGQRHSSSFDTQYFSLELLQGGDMSGHPHCTAHKQPPRVWRVPCSRVCLSNRIPRTRYPRTRMYITGNSLLVPGIFLRSIVLPHQLFGGEHLGDTKSASPTHNERTLVTPME